MFALTCKPENEDFIKGHSNHLVVRCKGMRESLAQ
jgi:hypothetical protein